MRNKHKVLLSAFSLALVALLAVSGWLNRVNRQGQSEQAMALLEEGIAQFRREDHEQALRTLQAVPGELLNDWRLPYYTGSTMITLKDYAGAVEQLETALQMNSGEKNVLFALGVAYYKLGNLSLSKAYFSSVLEIDPDHAEAKGLADIMASLERMQEEDPASLDNSDGG